MYNFPVAHWGPLIGQLTEYARTLLIIWGAIDMIFDTIRRTDNRVLNSEHCALVNSSVPF